MCGSKKSHLGVSVCLLTKGRIGGVFLKDGVGIVEERCWNCRRIRTLHSSVSLYNILSFFLEFPYGICPLQVFSSFHRVRTSSPLGHVFFLYWGRFVSALLAECQLSSPCNQKYWLLMCLLRPLLLTVRSEVYSLWLATNAFTAKSA